MMIGAIRIGLTEIKEIHGEGQMASATHFNDNLAFRRGLTVIQPAHPETSLKDGYLYNTYVFQFCLYFHGIRIHLNNLSGAIVMCFFNG